jgi:hypothetical protein
MIDPNNRNSLFYAGMFLSALLAIAVAVWTAIRD